MEDVEARIEKLEEEIKTKLTWWELLLGIVGMVILSKILGYFGL